MYTPSRRLSLASAACALALLMAGCASDDEPIASPSVASATPTPTPTPTATVDDFCQAKVAIDGAFLAGGPPEAEAGATPDPAKIAEGLRAAFSAPYAELKRTAQSEVAADVDSLVSLLDAGITVGNEDFMFSPEFAKSDAAVDDYLNDNCGFEKLSASAADYEYTGLPTVAPQGLTGLTLTNTGKEFHEMVLLRINDDVDLTAKEILALPEEEAMTKAQPMGVVLANPGTTATNFFDLKAGRYAVLCFISKGSDAAHDFNGDGPPHFTQGMLEDLKVLGSGEEATAEPTSSATTHNHEDSASSEPSTEPSSSS